MSYIRPTQTKSQKVKILFRSILDALLIIISLIAVGVGSLFGLAYVITNYPRVIISVLIFVCLSVLVFIRYEARQNSLEAEERRRRNNEH